MRILAKLALLCAAIVLLTPIVAGDTAFGRLVAATIEDTTGFCERQPDACRNAAALGAGARDFIETTAARLRPRPEGEPLTDDDRSLAPVPSFAAHNAPAAALEP